ncbi:MAG: histidinol phosphate phosphatase domain-containing protein [Candidatus Methanomethylicia archaeon]|nr:histidinol phosphate phosphatase domain-containing protein [Candidatus Methanomethylicia archaeon]
MRRKIYDFHMHSFFSDGELLPDEIVRRAIVLGHAAIAITDHVDASNMEEVVSALVRASKHVAEYFPGFTLIPGVEITHAPPQSIPELAKAAKRQGARIVVVHGESPVEPVAPGTNEAACKCPEVDILAHPGMISEKAVIDAKANGTYLELSYRGGHCLGNGRVAKLALEHGASLIVDSDAHSIGDLMGEQEIKNVAIGAGLRPSEAEVVMYENPIRLMKRLGL